MKKIGFISSNKVLVQSLFEAIKSRPELKFETFQLFKLNQVVIDAQVLEIDVAIIDIIDGTSSETASLLVSCRQMRSAVPDCHILFLLSQEDQEGKNVAISAVKEGMVDDFVFYDTSLQYLFAKMSAF